MFGFWIRSVLIICWLIPSECWGARFKIYFYPYSSLETRDHPDMDPGPSQFSWSDVRRLKCIALEWRGGVFLQWREHRAELRAVQQFENHQVCPVSSQAADKWWRQWQWCGEFHLIWKQSKQISSSAFTVSVRGAKASIYCLFRIHGVTGYWNNLCSVCFLFFVVPVPGIF